MARDRITKRVVDGLKTTGAEYFARDAELKGFGVRVQASGAKSGCGAPTRRMTLARVGNVTPEEARGLAKRRAGEAAHGADPAMDRRKAAASAEGTLGSVVENYLTREGSKLRTVELRRAAFKRVLSVLGARQIGDIKRSEINSLLDTIEDESGANTATLTLAYLRRVTNWHATRADDFHSPIVRGMARAVAVKRDRMLTEGELRAFWQASEQWEHPFSRMLRFILLTATRRDEAADMRWSEVDRDTWTIPAARYKTNIDFELPLSGAAMKLLDPIIRIGDAGFVFTMSGKHGMQGFAKFKAEFDGRMLAEARKMTAEPGDDAEKVTIERWTIHDLRRTARSLMTQAGIAPDHAERALGHVILGARGVYDRHSYHAEKQKAFEALAAQVERILDPQPNVVQLRSTMELTPEQCRAARGLVGWSQERLAEEAKVARTTLADFESGKRAAYEQTLGDIRRSLERMGVEFPEDSQSGVRLRYRTTGKFGALKIIRIHENKERLRRTQVPGFFADSRDAVSAIEAIITAYETGNRNEEEGYWCARADGELYKFEVS